MNFTGASSLLSLVRILYGTGSFGWLKMYIERVQESITQIPSKIIAIVHQNREPNRGRLILPILSLMSEIRLLGSLVCIQAVLRRQ